MSHEYIATSELFQNMSLLIVPFCLPCHKHHFGTQCLEINVQKNQQSSWVSTGSYANDTNISSHILY